MEVVYSDKFMAYILLKQDLFYSKIPVDEMNVFIERSLKVGYEKARGYLGKDIKEILYNDGIKVTYIDKSMEVGGCSFRAQTFYKKGKIEIIVYRNALKELKPFCDCIENVILAHEYFHCLELLNNEFVYEIFPRVSTKKIFKWEQKAYIRTTSEIAANKFSKEVNGLKIMPNYYDYEYLIHLGKCNHKESSYINDCFEEYSNIEKIFTYDY